MTRYTCGIKAVLRLTPGPVTPDVDASSDAIMTYLLDRAGVADPVVSVDPRGVVTIEVEVDAASPVSAFGKGRQCILEAVAEVGWAVHSIADDEHGGAVELVADPEPEWLINRIAAVSA